METKCCICPFEPNTDLSRPETVLPRRRLFELQRFHPARRAQSILAEALLRAMLAGEFGIHPAEAGLFRDENGRPHSPLCRISIAHTRGAVAAAISPETIGVDIERLRPPRLHAARGFFTPGELALANEHFWEIWTRKEAYAKAEGTGLTRELGQMDTLSPPLAYRFTTITGEGFVFSAYSQAAPAVSYMTVGELISLL